MLRYDPTTGALVDTFSSNLRDADAVAFGPDQNLYVSNLFGGHVERYDGSTGAYLGPFASISEPEGLAFGASGDLFVASFATNRVLRVDSVTGQVTTFVDNDPGTNGGLLGPVGITFGPDGNLYVASQTNHSVLRYSGTTGAFIDAFVPSGSGGLSLPWALHFGPDGCLFVSSVGTHAILRYDGTTGFFIGAFVAPGSGGLSRPTDFTFHDGSLFVVSSTGIPPAILRFDGTTGAFLGIFAQQGLVGPTGLVFYSWQSQVAPLASEVAVASGADGSRVVAWLSGNAIFAQHFDAGGTASAAPSQLSTSATGKPVVAANAAGANVVAWQESGGLFAQSFDANGTRAGGRFAVSDGGAVVSFDMALDASGGLVAAWDDGAGIRRRLFAPGGVARGHSVRIGSGTQPAVAKRADGQFIVVWQTNGNDGKQGNILWGQFFDPTGNPATTPVIVDNDPSPTSRPTVVLSDYGDAVVAWQKPDTTGKSSIHRRRLGSGKSLGDDTQVNPPDGRDATNPRVAVNAAGRQGFTWEETGSDGSSGVYGRFFTSDGTPDKTSFLIANSASPGGFVKPSVSIDNRDLVTVAFTDSSGSAAFSRTSDRQRSRPCGIDPTLLCLGLNDRFLLQVSFRDHSGNSGAGSAVRLTSDTGYFTFFAASNVEVVVKVLDACALSNHFWIFAAGLTDVEAIVTVTDTVGGTVQSFANPQNTPFQPYQNTAAFACGGTGAMAGSAADLRSAGLAPVTAGEDSTAPVAPCTADATHLCLNGGRFEVSTVWQTDGQSGPGMAVPLVPAGVGQPDTGYFWFFAASNVEEIIKVLDGCGLNQRYWVFAGGLTNVKVTTTVRDAVTGRVKTYVNPAGTAFAPITDTSALATCP